MKKIIILLISSMLILFGCSSSKDSANGDIPVVNWIMMGTEPKDQQIVEDEMNKILAEEYGVMVDFTYIDKAEYSQNVGLKISSGEEMDIIFAPSWLLDYNTYVSQGAYYDMTEMVMNSEIYNNINPLFWEGVTIDGKIYAVPTDKELACNTYALFNPATVEKYGWDLSTVDSFDDVVPFIEEYYQDTGTPGFYIDAAYYGAYKYFSYDCIGALDYQVCLDVNNPEGGYNWVYDYPEYVEFAKNADAMIEEGAVAVDTVNIMDPMTTQFATWTQEGPAGYTWQIGDTTGEVIDATAAKVQPALVTTDNVRGSLNVISSTSTQPEAAFTVLEAFNTNEELRNLLAYGIPGVHYNLDSNGQVARTEEGQNNYMSMIFAQGDYDILYTVDNEPVDKMDQIHEDNETATVSPALGSAPDLSAYQAEVANIMNVFQKYRASLYNFNSTNSVDDDLAKYRAELEAVGFFEVIDEINRQYQEFLNA